MSLRKTNILSTFWLLLNSFFTIRRNLKYCHCWTIITFHIINVWTHVFSVDRRISDSETGFDIYLCFIYVVLNLTTNFNVIPLFVSSLHEGWSISSRMYLLLALPHLWLTVLKLFHTKVKIYTLNTNTWPLSFLT